MNPGSDEARAAGCICAVLDNGRGRVPYMGWNEDGTGNWSVRADCPMHGCLAPENVEGP